MTTLQYYWADGIHTVFDGHTIDKNGVIKNINTGNVMTLIKNGKYNRVGISHEGNLRSLYVVRALASTFLGPPPTTHHTADHEDGNSFNDTLKNIRWLDKGGQSKNRDMPAEQNSAFIIVKGGVEHTAKVWADVYKKPNGEKYTERTIRNFAQQQKHEFRYKVFPKLRGEVWKAVHDSNNKRGEWFISNMNRVKYKTAYAENVLIVDQLCKDGGYPTIGINGKNMKCHELSMMTFRPREYVAKLPSDIILHKNDDKLDFNPFRLRWGTHTENRIDAYKNGKYDATTKAQKSVASYIKGVFEKEHDSISDAARYLQTNGYSSASPQNVWYGLQNDTTRYDRTWKLINP
jgi:hypothetical protein